MGSSLTLHSKIIVKNYTKPYCPHSLVTLCIILQNEELRFRGVPDLSGNDVDIQAMDMDAVPSDITFSIASSKIYYYLLYVLL